MSDQVDMGNTFLLKHFGPKMMHFSRWFLIAFQASEPESETHCLRLSELTLLLLVHWLMLRQDHPQ